MFKLKCPYNLLTPMPCHSRCLCISFFGRKKITFFDENIPGFELGLHDISQAVQIQTSCNSVEKVTLDISGSQCLQFKHANTKSNAV